ncbi:hypothetical protein TorRG33x02_048640 [Trema orientale]|uniref:Uncharacterized protein n=1 Tax=Trema orientale TaxID=63057 RepID=A0A2P5FNC9_TREOI|nr:hypothetical protein TorRG33x02_048640 [Trema orientale]
MFKYSSQIHHLLVPTPEDAKGKRGLARIKLKAVYQFYDGSVRGQRSGQHSTNRNLASITNENWHWVSVDYDEDPSM